jgi:triosephosphate isomerase (TIM)
MRKPFIAGNWKLNLLKGEAVKLAETLVRELKGETRVEIAVAPVFTVICEVGKVLAGSNIGLSGQDLYWENSGAFTGEVSPAMLKDAGCAYCIIGHSERREYFNETDQTVNRKVKAAIASGLTPIMCIGEKLEEREGEKTLKVIDRQMRAGLQTIPRADAAKIVLAYEPVWAIGTGKTATPAQAQEVHGFIRKLLAELYDLELAESIRIQYGGSVKPDNIKELMAQKDIDGALVGGASLKAESFAGIVKNSI